MFEIENRIEIIKKALKVQICQEPIIDVFTSEDILIAAGIAPEEINKLKLSQDNQIDDFLREALKNGIKQ